MKINYDCVRDVLLALEDELKIDVEEDCGDNFYSFNTLDTDDILRFDQLSKHSKQDIVYSVVKLSEAGYINTSSISTDDLTEFLIFDITYEGHEFLQSVKSDTVWNKVGTVTKKLGSISLPIISSIASSVLSKAITQMISVP